MMNKKLLFLALVLAIGFFSCQDNQEVLLEPNENGLVDVNLNSENNYFKKDGDDTKLLINSAGYTRWAEGDIVYVIDQKEGNEGLIGRPFTINGSGASNANFKGKLLAGRGTQTYYAYHAAEKTNCNLNGTDLTIARDNISYLLDEDTKMVSMGDYCTMVSAPVSFDVEKPNGNTFNFYHVNCLIEARVYPDDQEVVVPIIEFDKVEFKITAIDPSDVEGPTNGSGSLPDNIGEFNEMFPFNSRVVYHLDQTTRNNGTPGTVRFNYSELNDRVNTMTSVITYPECVKFSDRYTPGNKYFDIPIFSLPTTAKFSYQLDVIFYNEGTEVYHVSRTGWADGLRYAGLNDINFRYKNRVTKP